MVQSAEVRRNRAALQGFNQRVESIASHFPNQAVADNLKDLGSSVRRGITVPTTGAREGAAAAVGSIRGLLGQQAFDRGVSPIEAVDMVIGTQEITNAGEVLKHQLDYTFFPDPEERTRFAESNPDQLAYFLSRTPAMTVSVLHELRRTSRRPDIGRVAQMLPDLLEDLFSPKSVADVILMRARFYQTEEACREFWTDAAELIVRAQSGKPYPINRRLSAEEHEGIEGRVEAGMQQVQSFAERLQKPPTADIVFLPRPVNE